MPVKKCQENNKPGFKWGDKGKCYTGASGRSKAARQGRAVEANKNIKRR